MIIQESDYLSHVGVLGMRWHHRKGPTPTENKIESKSSNLDKWGTDKDHNILYITGYSGSGKSTLADKLKNKDASVIHLDPYLQKFNKVMAKQFQNKDFNNYLKVHFPEYESIGQAGKGDRRSKEWYTKIDKLMTQTEKFAATQFPKKKVIVEGVQLSDSTTYPDKSFFKDKPLSITNVGPITSFLRATKRDGQNPIKSIDDVKFYVQTYADMSKSMSNLAKEVDLKKGNDWIDAYLVNNN